LNSRTRSFQQVDLLADIDHQQFIRRGIKGIILDLDNTIVSEDDRYVSPGAEEWVTQAHSLGFRLFLLSNGRRIHRMNYWCDRLDVPGISHAKKPFPKNFRRAVSSMQLTKRQVVMIGDSFHTDVVGAWISACHCVQVASLPHPFSWWEKMAGHWLHRPYPSDRELWHFDGSLQIKESQR
jgi:uncharacterized protein